MTNSSHSLRVRNVAWFGWLSTRSTPLVESRFANFPNTIFGPLYQRLDWKTPLAVAGLESSMTQPENALARPLTSSWL